MEASEKRETESTFTTGLVLRQEGCTVGLTQGRASPSVRREGGSRAIRSLSPQSDSDSPIDRSHRIVLHPAFYSYTTNCQPM